MDKRFPIEDQIAMLASALRGRVVTPGQQDYDALRGLTHANFDSKPAAVIRVANAADVAAVLNFAQATGLELAVRSGGHSTCGHSGSNGGLVIDLRSLNGIEIDRTGLTAWLGSGLTAGEVTAVLEPQGLVIGFGDSATVGISGLTLGGGIGYFVRKHGLTLDSLLAAEVVTAAGDILMVDAAHHPDLFWALRGGGGNFGVVTRMKYRLHELPEFVGGPMILPATPDIIAGFVAAAEAAPDELSAIAAVMPAPPLPFVPAEVHGRTVFIAMMAYAGGPAAAEKALAPFRALATPLVDLVGPTTYASLYIPEDPNLKPAVSLRSQFVDRIGRDEAARIIEGFERGSAPMRMAQIRVLGGAFGRIHDAETAFAHRRSRIMVAHLALYGDAESMPVHERWVAECAAALPQDNARAYVNFLGATEGAAGLTAAYPVATWERLRRVKRRYDPENLFRLNQNIPPA